MMNHDQHRRVMRTLDGFLEWTFMVFVSLFFSIQIDEAILSRFLVFEIMITTLVVIRVLYYIFGGEYQADKLMGKKRMELNYVE